MRWSAGATAAPRYPLLSANRLVGSIPGAYFGARLSSRASAGLVRRALALVLLTAGLKMLGVSNLFTLVGLGVALVGGTVGWMLVRTRYGLKATNWQDRRITVRSHGPSD